MIQVENLTKKYDDFTAVRDVSFSVPTGQTLALVGTSGCGKTTTLKMINRLVEPTSGRILINGEDMMASPPEKMRRKIGYVIQNIGLFPHFTIQENVALVPNLLGWDSGKIKQRVFELLERLKLPPEKYHHRYPHQLSGGQRQRVGIARALAGNPPIILMDEPFGALDPITRNDIRNDFKDIEELSSKTIIIVTHDVEEAFDMADTVCILDKGNIQQVDSPKGLLFKPANDFVKRFLSDKLLQLEFHAIKLSDIFDQLPKTSTFTGQPILIPPSVSIFDALARITKEPHDQPHAQTVVYNQQKTYGLSTLMDAFHQTLTKWKQSP